MGPSGPTPWPRRVVLFIPPGEGIAVSRMGVSTGSTYHETVDVNVVHIRMSHFMGTLIEGKPPLLPNCRNSLGSSGGHWHVLADDGKIGRSYRIVGAMAVYVDVVNFRAFLSIAYRGYADGGTLHHKVLCYES